MLAFTLAVGAWLFRFDLVAANDTGLVYRLDRWTGNILVAGPKGKAEVQTVPANPFDKFDKE